MSEEMTYSIAVGRLEEIVADLERGGIALDETLKLYEEGAKLLEFCLLYTSPSPRDRQKSRMPSSA